MRRVPQFNKALLFLFVLGGLFLYFHQASAFLEVIPSLSDMQLGALDFIDRIVAWLFNLLLLALAGGFFITFSAALLDWASNIPVGLNNQFVQAGWEFTSGLANMIFILIFVAIALSYILKLETWGMKKALPRLIIIAFLLNFSLLFVKMFVDMGWIVQNSLKVTLFGDAGMAVPIASQVLQSISKAVFGYFAGFFLPYYLTTLIPFLSSVSLIAFATAILTTQVLFGTFSETFLLAAFGLVGGLIFFVYAILFLVRVAVIWLLAIAAPLAFAANILPQTQKYFQQWLKTLFQWVFLGAVVFFMMGLGLKFFAVAAPGLSNPLLVGGSFNITAYYAKFVFLLIYLGLTLVIAKKFAPAGTNAVWALGGLAVGGGAAFLAGKSRQWALKSGTWQSDLASRRAAARIQPLELKRKAGTITGGEETQLRKWSGKLEMAEARSQTYRSSQIQEQRRALSAKTKDMSEEGAKVVLRSELEKHRRNPLREKAKTAALYELLGEKDGLKDSDMDLYMEAWKAAGPEDAKKNSVKKAVLARKPSWGTYNERRARFEKIPPADIDKFSGSDKENDIVIKEMVGTLKPELFTRLGSQTKVSMEKVQKEMENTVGQVWKDLKNGMTDMNEFLNHVKTLNTDEKNKLLQNLEVIRYLHTSPATRTWKKYGSMEKGDPDNVTDRINGLRRAIK